MKRPNSFTPISIGCDDSINHIAFDGCTYYCTINCKCEIIALDDCFKMKHRYSTCKEYDVITYDYCEHCFWASSRSCMNRIFKLDCSMHEIDYIDVCGIGNFGFITGMSYNCCNNRLIVAFACAVAAVDKDSEEAELIYTGEEIWITGVLALCPAILLTILDDKKQYIEVIMPCVEKPARFYIGNNDTVRNLIFNPCKKEYPCPQMEAFVLKKHSYPYICKWRVSFTEMGFTPCPCNYRICEESCHEDCCEKRDACADIMESVALMQASISHILNAEGEKLQKVLKETNDIEKILCVNREINQTIVNATHLEHVLYAKLVAIENCCEPCGKPPFPPIESDICSCDVDGGII